MRRMKQRLSFVLACSNVHSKFLTRFLQRSTQALETQALERWLQVILDLTTLEQRGKYKAFGQLLSVLNGKRGVHLVVLYWVVGQWRVPWSFRLYWGKGTLIPLLLL